MSMSKKKLFWFILNILENKVKQLIRKEKGKDNQAVSWKQYQGVFLYYSSYQGKYFKLHFRVVKTLITIDSIEAKMSDQASNLLFFYSMAGKEKNYSSVAASTSRQHCAFNHGFIAPKQKQNNKQISTSSFDNVNVIAWFVWKS